MSNYAPRLPVDKNGVPMQQSAYPAKALARYSATNATASSVISLTQDTTAVEVAAVGATAHVRWIPVTETAAVSPFASVIAIAGATSNYDYVVAKDTVRRFVVPIETMAAKSGFSSVQGANRAEGLYQRIAVISAGVASVLTTEYGN